MMRFAIFTVLFAFLLSGCGRNQHPTVVEPGQAVYVANAGSNSISVFDNTLTANSNGTGLSVWSAGLAPAPGSPFAVSGSPTALAGIPPIYSPLPGPDSLGWLFVASAPAKTITVYELDITTGGLQKQVATISTPLTPQAIAVSDPNVYVADEEGYVSAYQFSGGILTEVPGSPFPAGTNPVAITLGSPGRVYVANAGSNNVSGYSIDSAGALSPLPGSPYAADQVPSSIAAYQPALLPGGFVLVTNQGSNDVSVFSEASDGNLSQVLGSPFATGTKPSCVSLAGVISSYVYVTNFGSDNISTYTLDAVSGILTPFSASPAATGPGPVSAASYYTLGLIYVANQGSNHLSVYTLDAVTGALNPISGSPFSTGNSPLQVLFLGPGPPIPVD